MIVQVYTYPLSFPVALFKNEQKIYSESERLNLKNLMRLLQLIPQIIIQTLYSSF